MKRYFSLVVFALIPLLHTSCSVLTGISNKYPAGWASQSHPPDPESAIVGVYNNFGDCTLNPDERPNEPSPSLGKLLAEAPYGAGTTVKISRLKPGTLQIEVFTRSDKQHTRVLEASNGDFRVADGAVWLRPRKKSSGDGSGYTGYAWEKESLGFRKSDDGALICEWRHSGTALAMWIIPLKGTQVFWMRWSPEKVSAK